MQAFSNNVECSYLSSLFSNNLKRYSGQIVSELFLGQVCDSHAFEAQERFEE